MMSISRFGEILQFKTFTALLSCNHHLTTSTGTCRLANRSSSLIFLLYMTGLGSKHEWHGDEKVRNNTSIFCHRKQILPFQSSIFTDSCQPQPRKTWNTFLYQSILYVNIVSCNSSSNCTCALSVKKKSIAAEKLGGVTGVCRPWMQPAPTHQTFFTVSYPPVEC